MQKIIDRVKEALENSIFDDEKGINDLNKIIAMAYYMGAEETAKEICNEHNKRAEEAMTRAANCRYYKMAYRVLQGETIKGKPSVVDKIYNEHYAGDMIATFGYDLTSV